MPQHLHLDFETFSEADLKAVGAYRYAQDESTEILCAAMALDDGEPVAWVPGMNDSRELRPYFEAYKNPEVLLYAHNSSFEIAVCRALSEKTFGQFAPSISRFRCTMSLARRAALPGKLEKLAGVLELKNLKDKKGSALIKKFSVMQEPKKPTIANPAGFPRRRIRPEDEPEAFAGFVEYCKQDVRAEQEVARRLRYFDSEPNNANYTLHEVINARGVTVNMTALRHAQKLIDEETLMVSAKFRDLTGFEVTQRARLMEWLHGLGFAYIENLQAETVDKFVEDYENATDTDAVLAYTALAMKQSIAYASIKKVKTMLMAAGPNDNRIRGMLNHHGATTGRSTNSLVQFQNMKRPTIEDSEDAYQMICDGCSREMLEICHGPVLEVISSCVRHFVQDV
jgi:DNA polymerase bacteriophage-type